MANTTSEQAKVWDLAIRLFHWSLVAAFAISYITEDEWLTLHTNSGYFIAALLIFRILWGFAGSRHARFRDFVYSPSTIIDYLRKSLRFQSPRYLGHNPAGGAMVVVMLLMLSITVTSGIALLGASEFAGPMAGLFQGEAAELLEEVHEASANLMLLLTALHLGGVLFSSLAHRENLVKAMITGLKRSNHQ